MAERVLTQRELNRALLARQLLLERARLPIPRALERIGGIQDQYAVNGYVRLWSCLEGFRREDLTAALERRSVVQATLMRSTIHLVSRRDFWPLAAALREPQRAWWLRTRTPPPDERELERTAAEIRELMADGPLRHERLVELTGRRWGAVGPWLELVRVPPSGTWEKRRANLFQTAERWIGPDTWELGAALAHLVRRYLGAFGPAPAADVALWAGTKPRDLLPTLERLRLRRFLDEDGKDLLDVPRAPLPAPDVRAPVRFLPTWDAVLLVHARRTGVLPERFRPLIFSTRAPQSVGAFLVDGAVAGTWRMDGSRVRWDAFERLPSATRREVAEEAERLAAFHA